MGLVLGSLVYFIGLCICFYSSIIFWLLCHCSVACNSCILMSSFVLLFFFFQDGFDYDFYSSSIKNVIVILMGISLDL